MSLFANMERWWLGRDARAMMEGKRWEWTMPEDPDMVIVWVRPEREDLRLTEFEIVGKEVIWRGIDGRTCRVACDECIYLKLETQGGVA